MRQKINLKNMSYIILTLLLFLMIIYIPKILANDQTYEINNYEDLIKYSTLSRTNGHQKDIYILKNDITITEEQQKELESSDFKYISFGSNEYPFAGTFDGNNHTIKNLKYSTSLKVQYDTGLFSQTTTGAVIKNLIIDNANIQSDYRGGIIAGYAEGTMFENIIVKNSHLFVSAADNVLTLITDGGIRGGALVGEANNSILYNCESKDNFVNTNNTSGVAALSGKGLTLGGLVGIANNTEVEYSRVIGGTVKAYYDVAVGALGGNTLYVGGIVGKMKSSKIIDSFSTAALDFYCATYVSVGAGNTGHIGGLTAYMEGNKNEIYRSHYAGETHSKQYNAVLVIPIIQENKNISGIADIYEGGAVVGAYFKPSLNPNVKMNVLGSATSTSAYGPLSDEKYNDKEFFQGQNYDLFGTIKRITNYNDNHYNKWVIDEELKIPVHGNTISATIDFPNAGSVEIEKTKLINTSVSTNNPYSFAVQGTTISDETINLSATQKEGYRMTSWYKVPKVSTWMIENDHDYFDDIFKKYVPISNEKEYKETSFEDKDLFVARYQARVIFHDIEGNIIDKATGKKVTKEDDVKDWYYYNDKIEELNPINKPESNDAKLIGWTTSTEKAYENTTFVELSDLKEKHEFYEVGDSITQTMDLYPVYINSLANIITIFEGNQFDFSSDISLRENVGRTTVYINESNEVVIEALGSEENNAFPEGYKFIGWYDEDDVLVSKEKKYTLTGVDLTKKHTYTAKFEYLVSYYVRAFSQSNGTAFTTSELYTSKYQKFNTPFDNIPAPGYIREHITHWGAEHVNHQDKDDLTDIYSGNIVAPINVYSHNYETATGSATGYQVYVDTDFPGSGTIFDLNATSGAKFEYTPTNPDRYNLQFWTLERKRQGWSYIKNPMNTGTLDPSVEYKARAIVTTNIIFHKKDNETFSVIRRYNDTILMDQDTSYTYKYPFMHTEEDVSTNPEDGSKGQVNNTILLNASPSKESMEKEDYEFIGWISSTEVEKNSNVWNQIYNVEEDEYCTTNISKAKKYVIDTSSVVTETMDLYPVYAKYNIITKTNVNSTNKIESINIPDNPTYKLNAIEEQYSKQIELFPDIDTFITGSSGTKYVLTSVEVMNEKQEIKTITPTEANKYLSTVKAGNTYTFIANYEPYVLAYHLNDIKIDVVVRNNGENVGEMPTPTYDIDTIGEKYIFVGYTRAKPSKGYMTFDSYDSFTSSNITLINPSMLVDESMELWPVYIQTNIKINSNIDDYIIEKNLDLLSIRNYNRQDIDEMLLKVTTESIDNYYFVGWYKDYKDLNNMGTLLSTNKEYPLQKEEIFLDITYTAVYKRVYTINYYDTEKNVVYTAKVEEDDNRTFVETTTDNEGKTTETPIDYQAFEEIHKTMKNNQIFQNFIWIKEDGTKVEWDTFANNKIESDVELYPIINEITVKDSNSTELNISTSSKEEAEILFGIEKEKIYASFNITYEQPYVNFHIESVLYGTEKEKIKDLDNYKIQFYADSDITKETIDNKITDSFGNAILKFYGTAKIKKETTNKNSQESFIFDIYNKQNPNDIIQTISILENEYITVKLPYGHYTATEDLKWAWRYSPNKSGELIINNKESKNLVITNNRVNNKWFDHITNKKNKFN